MPGEVDHETAFARYQAVRQPRADKVVNYARKINSQKRVSKSRVAVAIRDAMLPLFLRRAANDRSNDWLYNYRVTEESLVPARQEALLPPRLVSSTTFGAEILSVHGRDQLRCLRSSPFRVSYGPRRNGLAAPRRARPLRRTCLGCCPRGRPLSSGLPTELSTEACCSSTSLASLPHRTAGPPGPGGAEELSNLLDTVFSQLLMDAEDGGDLLKWGGDALLLLFDGADHGRRAARAGLRMHRVLAQIGRAKTSIGRVKLRASAGVESGPVHLILAGNPALRRDLVLLGPTATAVTMLEHAAGIGEVLVGDATAAGLGPGLVRPHEGLGSSPFRCTDTREPSTAA